MDTPQKINIEPENHPFEKEHHLNQTSILGFNILVFIWIFEMLLLIMSRWFPLSKKGVSFSPPPIGPQNNLVKL